VHTLWNDGTFALKPLELSANRMELTVQFFWQLSANFKVGDRVDLLATPASLQGLETAGDEAYFFYRREDGAGRPIRSGDVFKFTTTDPDKLLLPSVELLDMQWNLHRLLRLSGAAGWPQTDSDDGSDDIFPAAYGYANTNTYKWIPHHPLSPGSQALQSWSVVEVAKKVRTIAFSCLERKFVPCVLKFLCR